MMNNVSPLHDYFSAGSVWGEFLGLWFQVACNFAENVISEGNVLSANQGEPSTFSVLTKCDNRYTMKPCLHMVDQMMSIFKNMIIYTTNINYS